MQEDYEYKTILGNIWPLCRWGKGPLQYYQQHCSRVTHKKTLRHLRSMKANVLSSEEFSSPGQNGRGSEKEIQTSGSGRHDSHLQCQEAEFNNSHVPWPIAEWVTLKNRGNGLPRFTPHFFLELVHSEIALKENLTLIHILQERDAYKSQSQGQIFTIPFSLPHLPISAFS